MSAEKAMAAKSHHEALADIYQDDVSIAIWQRQLNTDVALYAEALIQQTHCFQARFIHRPERIAGELEKTLPLHKCRQAFVDDVALVADMFSCLFDLGNIGFRMAVLDKAMCPRFHVDRVPCRLLSTYTGAATEWHSHEQVNRFDDGTLEPMPNAAPHSLNIGDVALLKGESWEGNEGRGLVHRSPSASASSRRLVLTLDFA